MSCCAICADTNKRIKYVVCGSCLEQLKHRRDNLEFGYTTLRDAMLEIWQMTADAGLAKERIYDIADKALKDGLTL